MTYIQYIDCNKWKKVIGIILWVGVSIGLGSTIYYLVNYTTFDDKLSCYIDYNGPNGREESCYADHGQAVLISWVLSLLGNLSNTIGIFLVINHYYKLIEIRCGVKSK